MFRVLSLCFVIFFITGSVSHAFDCSGAKCGHLSSCTQATQELYVCGATERDGDSDGIPCEQQCGQDQNDYRKFLARNFPGLVAAFDNFARGSGGSPEPGASPVKRADPLMSPTTSPAAASDTSRWQCGAKRRCGEMTSCDEARFYLTTCGVHSLDGDRDGVPCNSLCRRTR